jgi:pyruvate kinase
MVEESMSENMNAKRTKIVAALGPATNSEEMIQALAERGVDVFRINFSHGTDEERLATIAAVKKVRGELDLPLAILQDVQGPKIRLGTFSEGPCEIATGDAFCLTTHMVNGNKIIITAGSHAAVAGSTNLIKVEDLD